MTTLRMADNANGYWKKIAGIELYKVNWFFKYLLYKCFGYKLPKLSDQRKYWEKRGQAYYSEITSSGYLEREVFFQDLLIGQLKELQFDSFFEAGCGFGWNIVRVKKDFSDTFVGGVDFSYSQLQKTKDYFSCTGGGLPIINGDVTKMPLIDNAFDVGFSLGVFMNIHPKKIRFALSEMMRVCQKYIIHIEYAENHTTKELREKRAFKTNIVSHDYEALYKELGGEVVKFLDFRDFGDAYNRRAEKLKTSVDRWEGFEGPEKYIFIVVKV